MKNDRKKRLKGEFYIRGFSCAEIARRLGITSNTLSFKMNGKSTFSIGEAIAIGDILKLKPDELIEIFREYC